MNYSSIINAKKYCLEEFDLAKITDRNSLAIVSGLIGLAGTMLVDEVSRRTKISKRSYRVAAAGMFVSKSEASSIMDKSLEGS